MKTNVFDYTGKIVSIQKTRDNVVIVCNDGLTHEMERTEYDEQVDFAQFRPRKGTEIRGFRVLDGAGNDITYKFYFCC